MEKRKRCDGASLDPTEGLEQPRRRRKLRSPERAAVTARALDRSVFMHDVQEDNMGADEASMDSIDTEEYMEVDVTRAEKRGRDENSSFLDIVENMTQIRRRRRLSISDEVSDGDVSDMDILDVSMVGVRSSDGLDGPYWTNFESDSD